MKRNDLFFFGGVALLFWGLWQIIKGRSGSGIPANQFGAALNQAPGPQLRYGAPQFNDTGSRPVVSRGNQVLGAIQSGAAVAVSLTDAFGAIGRTFRNIFGGGEVRTPAGPYSTESDRAVAIAEAGGSFDGPGGQTFDTFGTAAFPQGAVLQNSEGFDSGRFDPDRPFDSDLFAA